MGAKLASNVITSYSIHYTKLYDARAEANGAVGKLMCANDTSAVLRDTPGFESISRTMSPLKLSASFAKLPGVYTKDHYDNDPDDNSGVLMIQAEADDHRPDLPF